MLVDRYVMVRSTGVLCWRWKIGLCCLFEDRSWLRPLTDGVQSLLIQPPPLAATRSPGTKGTGRELIVEPQVQAYKYRGLIAVPQVHDYCAWYNAGTIARYNARYDAPKAVRYFSVQTTR